MRYLLPEGMNFHRRIKGFSIFHHTFDIGDGIRVNETVIGFIIDSKGHVDSVFTVMLHLLQ